LRQIWCERVKPGGEWTALSQYDGWPSGMMLGLDRRLWIADYRRGILALDPVGEP